MRNIVLATLVIVTVFVPAASGTHNPPANDWPQFMYDVTHQGAVSSAQNDEFGPFTQRWWGDVSIPQPVTVRGSPVVSGDMVYVAASDGYLYAFDKENGALIWRNETGGPASSTPVVAGGYVYVVSESGTLRAYSASSGIKRPFAPEVSVGATRGSPAIHEQLLVVGTTAGTVSAYLVDTFQLLWTMQLNGAATDPCRSGLVQMAPIDSTPAIHNGNIYIGSTSGWFFRVTETTAAVGTVYPTACFNTGGAIRASAAVDQANNRVIVGSENGKVYSLSLTWTGNTTSPAWTYQETANRNPSQIKSSASISGGKVYFGAKSGNITALDLATGVKRWVYSTNQEIVSSPSSANGYVIVGSKDRYVYLLHQSNGTVAWKQQMSGEVESSPAISKTQAFWVTIDGSLHSWGGAKPARADLKIEEAPAPGLTTGQTATFQVTIRNGGVLASTPSVARFYAGSTLLPDAQVPALEPNATHVITASYAPPSAGQLRVRIVLDAFRQVPESDEGNNERVLVLTVTDPPPVVAPTGGAESTQTGIPGFEGYLLVLVLGAAILRGRRRSQKE